MALRDLIKQLNAADEQLEEVLINRLTFQPQSKMKFDFTVIINRELKFLYMSLMGLRILGLKSVPIMDKSWKNIGLSFDRFEELEEKIKELFNTRGASNNNYIGEFNIETRYYFEYLLSPIYTSNGDIEAVMCSFTDVTERKLTETAFDDPIAQINQLIDLCPIPAFLVDKEEKITIVNEEFTKDFSLSQSDLIGKHYGLITNYLGIEPKQSVVSKALKGIKTFKKLSKSENSFLLSATPLREQATGAILGAIIISSDITDCEKIKENYDERRQNILKQYLTENRKLNQLIELCLLGIVLYDNQGNVIELNRAHNKYVSEFNRSKFIGKPGSYLLEALGLNWENSPCSLALEGIETLDHYCKSKDGKLYLVNAIPLRDYQNAIIGAMTIIHDITEYEKIKVEMTNLDRLNLMSEMSAGVAHEIRNPMTVIKGYLQFLGKSVPDSIREQFCIVLSELGRIESIITDFLSLAGNKIVENKEQNLNAIIEGIIPLIMADATDRGIELKINLAEELPCLMLNAKEIKQLLLNLTRNGIEAMGQRGTLIIESIIEGDTISLCVEDSGCGIRKENQEKIFDPFFTTKDDGTGLGLSICAGIVRRNNGIIKVRSEQGKGTRFTITFKDICVTDDAKILNKNRRHVDRLYRVNKGM